METKETTYFKGDKCEYIDGQPVTLYGGIFFAVRMLEGLDKGKIKYITRVPTIKLSQKDIDSLNCKCGHLYKNHSHYDFTFCELCNLCEVFIESTK